VSKLEEACRQLITVVREPRDPASSLEDREQAEQLTGRAFETLCDPRKRGGLLLASEVFKHIQPLLKSWNGVEAASVRGIVQLMQPRGRGFHVDSSTMGCLDFAYENDVRQRKLASMEEMPRQG
jgi:hypothetical protein